MKKIYTVLTAVVLLSFPAISQQYTSNDNSGVQIQHDGRIQMNIIGNPVRDVITLQVSNPISTKYELSLFTETGRKVSTMLYDHPAGVSTKTISVSNLEHGIYFLVATSDNGKQSFKVLKQ
ncbi:MAG TPA: T9SS type A sorting domain-containing protein [Parafilimonas sp.]|jgi:predicted phosphohydrolase